MGTMFSLTGAGRRVHDQPSLYPQYDTEEMKALLSAIERGALSFDGIVQAVPGKMFRVLQEMATALATGLLKANDAPTRTTAKRGHGHW